VSAGNKGKNAQSSGRKVKRALANNTEEIAWKGGTNITVLAIIREGQSSERARPGGAKFSVSCPHTVKKECRHEKGGIERGSLGQSQGNLLAS